MLNEIIDTLNEEIVLMDPAYNILTINTAFLKIYSLKDVSTRIVLSCKCYLVLQNKCNPRFGIEELKSPLKALEELGVIIYDFC